MRRRDGGQQVDYGECVRCRIGHSIEENKSQTQKTTMTKVMSIRLLVNFISLR